jgi:hypothetical protein
VVLAAGSQSVRRSWKFKVYPSNYLFTKVMISYG